MKQDVALTAEDLPLACTLTAPELVTRGAEIDDLFTGVQQTEELTDGYALRFPGSPTWAERLLSFIQGERSCCLFFTFELVFQPNQGPIWLHIRGKITSLSLLTSSLLEIVCLRQQEKQEQDSVAVLK